MYEIFDLLKNIFSNYQDNNKSLIIAIVTFLLEYFQERYF